MEVNLMSVMHGGAGQGSAFPDAATHHTLASGDSALSYSSPFFKVKMFKLSRQFFINDLLSWIHWVESPPTRAYTEEPGKAWRLMITFCLESS